MKKFKRTIVALTISLLVFQSSVSFADPNTQTTSDITSNTLSVMGVEAPDIRAEAFILMDVASGTILTGKNIHQQMSPASTTKIMTAIVAMTYGELDRVMTANRSALDSIGYDYVRAGIVAGEELLLESLLNSLLITSANEAANVVAENIAESGKTEDFVILMNDMAQKIGCKDTQFQNTFGADHETHYTTARDLAAMTAYAKKEFPLFNEIVQKDSYTLPETNKHKADQWHPLQATNKLLSEGSSHFSKVTGVKTGYTNKAGNCLVSSAVNDSGMELIAVVLNTHKDNNVFVESKALLEFGFKNFAMQTYALPEQLYQNLKVKDAKENQYVKVITDGELETILPKDKSQWGITKRETVYSDKLVAPIQKNEIMGKIEYIKNEVVIGQIELIAAEDVDISTLAYIRNTCNDFLKGDTLKTIIKVTASIIAGLILLLVALRIIFRNFRRQSKSQKMMRKNRYRIDHLK